MDAGSIYQSNVTAPDRAVEFVPFGFRLSMGMAMAEPPTPLKAPAVAKAKGGA